MNRLCSMALFSMAATVLTLNVGCNNPRSPRGFSLPEGDIARGQATFERLGCPACHEVIGVRLVPSPFRHPEIMVVLGGQTERVKTYGQLVTSIINPSHRFAPGYARDEISADGVSRMQVYNDVMTVAELIDLVAFLQSHYELKPFERTDYTLVP